MPTTQPITEDPSIFTMRGAVEFAATEQKRISLNLYDGSIQDHWYWGKLAFDLSKAKLAKGRIPILLDHDTTQRIGYSTAHSFDGGISLEGQLLENSPLAAQIRSEFQDGFPFEASLRFDMEKSKIRRIGDGEEAEVNGMTFKGPGAIVNPVLMEGSVCTFGALTGCKTQIFHNLNGDETMSEKEITVEVLQKQHPDVYDAVFKLGVADGEKRERDAFKAIREACPDGDIAGTAFMEGKSPLEARCMFQEKEIESLKAAANAKPAAKPEKTETPDPAKAEFVASDKAAETKPKNAPRTDDDLKAEFAASADLQEEFGGDEAAYVAFVKADRAGLVEMKG